MSSRVCSYIVPHVENVLRVYASVRLYLFCAYLSAYDSLRACAYHTRIQMHTTYVYGLIAKPICIYIYIYICTQPIPVESLRSQHARVHTYMYMQVHGVKFTCVCVCQAHFHAENTLHSPVYACIYPRMHERIV